MGGQVVIQPEDRSVPAISIPNTVGAKGVDSSSMTAHDYKVQSPSSLSTAQGGAGFANNPTPGNDSPASPMGTRNNAGPIPFNGDTNMVKSFTVASPDPSKFSDITVNYTIAGEHGLAEGFVMNFSAAGAGSNTLTSYGEGTNWQQSSALESVPGIGWGPKVQEVWKGVHREIEGK